MDRNVRIVLTVSDANELCETWEARWRLAPKSAAIDGHPVKVRPTCRLFEFQIPGQNNFYAEIPFTVVDGCKYLTGVGDAWCLAIK